jgi:type IV pilus assembly protein PilB
MKISKEASFQTIENELAKGTDVSIIALVNGIIYEAHELRASDIHIDPLINGVRVRLRVDGVLQDVHLFSKNIHTEVVSRIKVLAGLRTDEHASSQDGRFRHTFHEVEEVIDIRVSIVPTYHGETIVMRLLGDRTEQHTLTNLGFSKTDQEKIITAIHKPNGMILATGPTGSGKTTTLYTLLKALNTPEISIVTIEDPIEFAVDRVEQIQVNTRAGLTFANGLRSILRQDPNIIMVGEIRDSETAGIAINTALTGHLLLSTLHTNDAATTLPRLLDMGIDAYLVASTVNAVIGQRLVRKICTNCKQKVRATSAAEEALAGLPLALPVIEGDIFYKGKGCNACKMSGYLGRICINEVLIADTELREAIMRKESSSTIKNIAIKNGMTTMLEDGFSKVKRGDTTVEEILRVVHN